MEEKYRPSIIWAYKHICVPMMKERRNMIADISGVNEKHSILDVACGGGRQTLLYAQRGAYAIGLDLSEPMIEMAKQHNGKYNNGPYYIHGDATNMGFSDGEFDISTIAVALHELEPSIRSQIVGEMARVTRDDGTIVICDFAVHNGDSISSYVWGAFQKTAERIAGGEHHRNYKDFMNRGGVYNPDKPYVLDSILKECNLKADEYHTTAGGNVGILKLSFD
jgi:ubiquinone/menaquinone biosynthesis C-methylase UbiE